MTEELDKFFFKNFCYKGKLEGRNYFFRIDMSFDVSIVNEKFIEKRKERLIIKDRNLRYPPYWGESFF